MVKKICFVYFANHMSEPDESTFSSQFFYLKIYFGAQPWTMTDLFHDIYRICLTKTTTGSMQFLQLFSAEMM